MLSRTVENQVIGWQPQHNICLPIGGKTVYVSRQEANALAQLAQASDILGENTAQVASRLLKALEQMRSVANNPLLARTAEAA